MIFKTQLEFLETIERWNFKINPLSKSVNSLDEIEKKHKRSNKKILPRL